MKFYQKHSRLVAVLTFAFFVLVGAIRAAENGAAKIRI